MAKLTASPAAQTLGQSVTLGYTGAEYNGQLRITRPGGSKYYIPTTSINGSKSYKPTATGSYRADLLNRKGSVLSTVAFGIVPVVVVPPPPPPPPVTPPLPTGAVKMADEPLQGEPAAVFTQPADGQVWYGASGKFFTKPFTKGASVTCSNATFGGDPIPYVRKACYVAPFAVPPPPPPIFTPVLSGVPGVNSVTLHWTDGEVH